MTKEFTEVVFHEPDPSKDLVCEYHPTVDRLGISFDKLIVGDQSNTYSITKILNLLEDRRWQVFLDVLNDNHIDGANAFENFLAVVNEHCISKGITDYDTIKKTWADYCKSLQEAIEHIKEEFKKGDVDD